MENALGGVCNACDRIWFENGMTPAADCTHDILAKEFSTKNVARFHTCLAQAKTDTNAFAVTVYIHKECFLGVPVAFLLILVVYHTRC